MLHIIHLFSHPKLGSELCLWIEVSTARYYAARYPYQLDETALKVFNASWFNQQSFLYDEQLVSLPCDGDGVPVPSGLIADRIAIGDRTMTQCLPWTLCVGRVKEPLSFLNILHALQHQFEDGIRLGFDAQYWIQMGLENTCHESLNKRVAPMPYSAFLNETDVNQSVDAWLTIESFWGSLDYAASNSI